MMPPKKRPPRANLRRGVGRTDVVALIHRSPELLPLFRGHVPAPPAESASTVPSRTAVVQPSEEDPAQRQQAECLPEAERPPAEQRRQQPIPQMHHHFAAHEKKQWNRYNCQRRNPIPSLSHSSSLVAADPHSVNSSYTRCNRSRRCNTA